METQVLYMTFIDEHGKKRTLSIEEPTETLTETDIKKAMDDIITADIFEDKLISKDSARFVTKVIEDIAID